MGKKKKPVSPTLNLVYNIIIASPTGIKSGLPEMVMELPEICFDLPIKKIEESRRTEKPRMDGPARKFKASKVETNKTGESKNDNVASQSENGDFKQEDGDSQNKKGDFKQETGESKNEIGASQSENGASQSENGASQSGNGASQSENGASQSGNGASQSG
ncbi:MAG: hypothetical protein LBF79_00585, partial [Dysgonamonadaceae bacterium]|nr:hypothetical protein [Dysgonamonadaceae bacterium]